MPRSLSSTPQIPDLSRSTYLVTLWHCCEHLTTLSHKIRDLLSTSSHHELPKSLCRSFSVTNPIQPGTVPLPAGCRAMLPSPLCSSSLVLLCQRSP